MAFKEVRRPHEVGHELGLRGLVDVSRRTFLDQNPVGHDSDVKAPPGNNAGGI